MTYNVSSGTLSLYTTTTDCLFLVTLLLCYTIGAPSILQTVVYYSFVWCLLYV